MSYIQGWGMGWLKKNETKDNQAIEVYMPSRTKEKVAGVWDFQGEEGSSYGGEIANVW